MANEPVSSLPISGEVPRRRPEPDCGLMVRVAEGDVDAYTELYDLTAPRVFGLAHRVLRNRAMAEEVSQEVMLELWRTAARYDPHLGSIINWVLLITNRRAIDRVRAEQASTRREDLVASRSNIIAFDQVADTAAHRVDADWLPQYVDALTDLQRQVIILAYDHGYSAPEIALLLDVKLSTVKARIRGAHRALHKSITGKPRPDSTPETPAA